MSREQINSGVREVRLEYPLSHKPFFIQLVKRFHPEGSDQQLTRKLQLDGQGTTVWELIDGQRSVADIIRIFSEEQEIAQAEATHAVTLFLRELGKRGLILLRDPDRPQNS